MFDAISFRIGYKYFILPLLKSDTHKYIKVNEKQLIIHMSVIDRLVNTDLTDKTSSVEESK